MRDRDSRQGETPREGRIEQLDGWRAIAAVAVVAGHLLGNAHLHLVRKVPGLYDLLNSAGHLGLEVLFVISGYIICRLLLIEEQRFGSFSFRGFYVRRFVRVLPPFYLYLAVIALLVLLHWVVVPWHELGRAAALVVDFHPQTSPWLTGHVWSLSVEEQFYLIFPTALWLTPGRRRPAAFTAAAAVVTAATLWLALSHQPHLLTAGVMAGFAGIAWGVVLSLHEVQARRFARRLPASLVVTLACALLALSFVRIHDWRMNVYQALLLIPAVCVFLMFTLERQTWFSRWLAWGPLRLVGITSYSLYLWQELFTGTSNNYAGPGRAIPYLMPLLLLIVPFSWVYIEKPSMALGKSLSRRWRSSPRTEQGLSAPLVPLVPIVPLVQPVAVGALASSAGGPLESAAIVPQ